jgi:D-methionine transport system substrate-binding protein
MYINILEENPMKKKLLALVLTLGLTASLAACGDSAPAASSSAGSASTSAETVTLRVAASPTPHAEILNAVKGILADQGIDLQVTEYDDYVVPNTAVEEGDEDANYFQHQPYLDNFNAENGTHLVSAGGIHIEPMGVYAGKTCPTAPPSPSPTMPPTRAARCCCWNLRGSLN